MITLLAAIATLSSATPAPDVAGPATAPQFAVMKSLAGAWRGKVTTDNPAWATDKPMPLSIRLASHGNAVLHEFDTGGPEVSVFYIDNGRLAAVHYCDFANRPHLVARPSTSPAVIDFDVTEAPGSQSIGHVSHATFRVVDPSHHVEDWTFVPARGAPVHAHIDFERVP